MGQLTISWSALKAHKDCKQRSHLLRTGHRSSIQDIRQFFHGTVADRVMREYLDEEANQYPGFMAESVARIMDREEIAARETGDGIVKWRSREDRAEVFAFVVDICTKLEPILDGLVIPRQYQSAYKFRAPIRIPYLDGSLTSIRLIGEMDILTWDVDNSHYEVYDLKATKNEQYWRTTIAQTVFYDLAVYAQYGVFTDRVGLIQPGCKKQIIDYEVTTQMRTELMQSIIRMAHDIWKKDHSLRPDTTKCGFCVVKHACSRYESKDGRVTLGGSTQSLDDLWENL